MCMIMQDYVDLIRCAQQFDHRKLAVRQQRWGFDFERLGVEPTCTRTITYKIGIPHAYTNLRRKTGFH